MTDPDHPIRHVVGVMTGTSVDGIDAALVRIHGRGLAMRATLVRHIAESLCDLQLPLRAAANQQPMTAGEFAKLAWDFGMLHTEVIQRLAPDDLSLICIHGQTVFHQPPFSWQLVNPAPIAARFGCPVVSDLRQADLALGGQGAPVTPIADWILFRDETKTRAIANLGGFCNVTILPAVATTRAGTSLTPTADSLRGIRGFDVCACNQLLDAIAREVLGQAFDNNGAAAARGHASPQAGEALRAILEDQRQGGRSLGTGDEAGHWIHTHRGAMPPADLAATSVQAVAQTILHATREHEVDELILAGGGARNLALRAALQKEGLNPASSVRISDEIGVPHDAREAMCFAILGALCHDGVPITLPQVTGCSQPAPLSGNWSHSHACDMSAWHANQT